MLVRTENVSEIYNLVVSAEKALSYENFDNFVLNWLGIAHKRRACMGSATEFRPFKSLKYKYNTKLIDVSMITNMSLLRNDYFELKTVDLKLMTSQWRHHCCY